MLILALILTLTLTPTLNVKPNPNPTAARRMRQAVANAVAAELSAGGFPPPFSFVLGPPEDWYSPPPEPSP